MSAKVQQLQSFCVVISVATWKDGVPAAYSVECSTPDGSEFVQTAVIHATGSTSEAVERAIGQIVRAALA